MFRKTSATEGRSTILTPRWHPRRPKIDPRRLQDDLQEVFCSHRFLSSILVGLGSDLGSQKGARRESKSVIFGIDFSLIFTCRSRIAPRAAKRGPRVAQERPRAAQEEPKSGPRVPKRAPRAPNAPKIINRFPFLGDQVGAQNQYKFDVKAIQKAIIFWIKFLSNLVPFLLEMVPKSTTKWSKVGSKIDPSWGVDLRIVLEGILAAFLLILQHNMTWRSSKND